MWTHVTPQPATPTHVGRYHICPPLHADPHGGQSASRACGHMSHSVRTCQTQLCWAALPLRERHPGITSKDWTRWEQGCMPPRHQAPCTPWHPTKPRHRHPHPSAIQPTHTPHHMLPSHPPLYCTPIMNWTRWESGHVRGGGWAWHAPQGAHPPLVVPHRRSHPSASQPPTTPPPMLPSHPGLYCTIIVNGTRWESGHVRGGGWAWGAPSPP